MQISDTFENILDDLQTVQMAPNEQLQDTQISNTIESVVGTQYYNDSRFFQPQTFQQQEKPLYVTFNILTGFARARCTF